MSTLLHDRSVTTHHRPTGSGIDPPVIEVDGLVKAYAGVRVVDRVSFAVAEGEIFGLLGANGAGKTTTVECLQGLRRPDGGRVRVLGLDPVADHRRLRSQVGSQLQDSALPDRLRVGEAIALFDRSGSGSGEANLRRWGLHDAVATSWADLSGGQRQRLCIVLALLNDPRILFLDELTQGLDPAARRNVWQVVRDVREQGTTVVLVSHFAEEIEALCDRVAVMSHGRVVDTGTPLEVTDRHAAMTTVTCTRPSTVGDRDLERLAARPDVRTLVVDDDRLTVSGTSTMVAAACAATLDPSTGSGPVDLRVRHASLDDALVNLIGDQP